VSRLAILAEGLFAKHTGKTAHGVIRYGTREVVAVIDSSCAGRTAGEVEPFCVKPVPIVAASRRPAAGSTRRGRPRSSPPSTRACRSRPASTPS
jgi:uncharacterized NAD-dependent epimerase/dehydratase family protein